MYSNALFVENEINSCCLHFFYSLLLIWNIWLKNGVKTEESRSEEEETSKTSDRIESENCEWTEQSDMKEEGNFDAFWWKHIKPAHIMNIGALGYGSGIIELLKLKWQSIEMMSRSLNTREKYIKIRQLTPFLCFGGGLCSIRRNKCV